MSNALWWAPTIRESGQIFEDTEPGKIGLIDPYDVAAVAVTQPGHAGHGCFVTGPEALSPSEQTAILSDILGRSLKFVATTPEEEAQKASPEEPPRRRLPHEETSTSSSPPAGPASSPTTSSTSRAPRPEPSAPGQKTAPPRLCESPPRGRGQAHCWSPESNSACPRRKACAFLFSMREVRHQLLRITPWSTARLPINPARTG